MQQMAEYAWDERMASSNGRFHKLNGSVRRKNGQIRRYLPQASRAQAGIADVIKQIELASFFDAKFDVAAMA